jgi:hypothetical protein
VDDPEHQYWWSYELVRRNELIEAVRTAGSPGPWAEDGMARGHSSAALFAPRDAALFAPQVLANRPACRQCPEPDVGNPLGMRSGSADPDDKPVADAASQDSDSGATGFSQFLSKIFDQLSITSWLPAAMLVGNGAVLLQLREDHNYKIALAVKQLAGKPLGTLIILIFALILATIVTQAFEFEVIQLLEGYLDSARRPVQGFMATRVRRHSGKRLTLECKFQAMQKGALLQAFKAMREQPGYDLAVLDALREKVEALAVPTDEVLEEADELMWRDHLPADTVYRIDCLDARVRSYPEKSRVMPTRLGNVLRAVEDKVELGPGEALEGFVIRHYDELPHAVRKEHGDYRNRLDMYCSLVLVYFVLAAISVVLLYRINPVWGIAIAVSLYGLMSYVAYEAAIASARGYGVALLEISDYMKKRRQAIEELESSTELDELSTFARFRALLHRNPV